MSENHLYPRYIKPFLVASLKDSPAVLIHGSSPSGKTTLAQIVGKAKKYKYISFDDEVALRSDFKGLKQLKAAVGKNFIAGVLLYNGDVKAPFGDKLYAIPLNALWV